MSGIVLAVIAQGGKRLALGDHLYEYGPGQYLVASVDLPLTGRPIDTRRAHSGIRHGPRPRGHHRVAAGGRPRDLLLAPAHPIRAGIAVTDAPADLPDAVVRLLRLLDRPADREILAPMIKREILWYLLRGQQGGDPPARPRRQHLAHISRAARWIRENYADSFRVEELARTVSMSASAFHRNFSAVTGTSPVQFQKHIRLQEARLLLASRPPTSPGSATPSAMTVRRSSAGSTAACSARPPARTPHGCAPRRAPSASPLP